MKASESGVPPGFKVMAPDAASPPRTTTSSPTAARTATTVDDAQALHVRSANGRRLLDLGRDVHALMGLVFDRIDLQGAAAHLRRCIDEQRPCFLSTPNVNFVAAAQHDAAFRDSVLHSDLSVADGFPIVRVARWMGIDLPDRVAGADLFERLQREGRSAQRPPIRLFLFGGPPGVGAVAAQRLNAQGGGFECVGHDEGGFGDVQAMSTPATLERVNASGAQFVLVALGARKGQAWIELNRSRLDAPVISHLGAVINFAAQSVARAPRWMQRCGLEWVWRIVQEPQLWRRYWQDGLMLGKALVVQVLAWQLRQRFGPHPAGARQPARFTLQPQGADRTLVELSGNWREGSPLAALRHALAGELRAGRAVVFDLGAAPAVGSGLLGLLCLVDAWQVSPRAVLASSVRDRALRSEIRAFAAEHLLEARSSSEETA